MRILVFMKNGNDLSYKQLKKRNIVNNIATYYWWVSHLRDMNLITKKNKKFILTKKGEEFAKVFEELLKVYEKYFGD